MLSIFFSTYATFCSIFSTQKCVNSDKTDFATKVRKLRQNQLYNKMTQIVHMWRHFSHHTHARCGKISYFSTSVMRRNLKLLHMWKKFKLLPICHVENLKLFYMTNFSSTDKSVGSVTNIRYVVVMVNKC